MKIFFRALLLLLWPLGAFAGVAGAFKGPAEVPPQSFTQVVVDVER